MLMSLVSSGGDDGMDGCHGVDKARRPAQESTCDCMISDQAMGLHINDTDNNNQTVMPGGKSP